MSDEAALKAAPPRAREAGWSGGYNAWCCPCNGRLWASEGSNYDSRFIADFAFNSI